MFLFADLVRKKLGMRVESIQAGFPDGVAIKGSKRIRIEFEYRSTNFRQHRHDPRRCDAIVCWIDDWSTAPPRLQIIELRRYFGLGFNVWLQPVRGEFSDQIAEVRGTTCWSVNRRAKRGDLVLFYRAAPESSLADIFEVQTDAEHVSAGWRTGKDWMADMRRTGHLETPLHFKEMQAHRVLKSTPFVRAHMQGRHCITEHWPVLRDLLLARNGAARKQLAGFGPERNTRG